MIAFRLPEAQTTFSLLREKVDTRGSAMEMTTEVQTSYNVAKEKGMQSTDTVW